MSEIEVSNLLVLSAGPADTLRHALDYLRRKHAGASITLVADEVPAGIEQVQRIAPGDWRALGDRRFELAVLFHARGSSFWRPCFANARFLRSLAIANKQVITDDGRLYPFRYGHLWTQFLLIPLCRFIVSPLLILFFVPAMKLLRWLSRLYSPENVREINGWPTDDPTTSASQNTAMMVRQYKLLTRDNDGKIPRELCRERECIVCGENDPEKIFDSEDGFDYVRCRGCGYVYVNPILSDLGWRKLNQMIDDHKNEAARHFSEERQSDEGYRADAKRFEPYLKRIGKHCNGPGRLLDVGCSTGNFLRYARSQGWDVVGLEVEESRCEIGREKYGLEMINGKVEEIGNHPALPAESFDVVTFWESMEHVEDPNPALERVRGALKPGGLVAMTVNNIDYVDSLLMKQQCYDLLGIGHINMFNVDSMTRWLERFDFDPMSVETVHQSSLEELVAFLDCDPNRIYSLGNFDRRMAPNGANGSRLEVHPRSSSTGLAFTRLFSPWLHYQMNSLSLGPLLLAIGKKQA